MAEPPKAYVEIAVTSPKAGVELLTLNRPDQLNTLSRLMVSELNDYFACLKTRTHVRVVLLQGKGKGLCAGLDIKDWAFAQDAHVAHTAWASQKAIGDIVRKMRACPQPIIALAHGPACGGGMSLMLASDVRYGAPSLKMNAAYIKIGLGGCDIGSSYFLPRLIGASAAAEIILTGRFITAERALHFGLLSEVVEEEALLAKGLALADEMLSNSPMGLRLSKEALNLNIDAQGLEAAMAIEDRQQVMLLGGEDFREATLAFVEKRKPVFRSE